MKHDHVEHEHKVKYCKKCNLVFCEVDTCNTEWSTNTWFYTDTGTGFGSTLITTEDNHIH